MSLSRGPLFVVHAVFATVLIIALIAHLHDREQEVGRVKAIAEQEREETKRCSTVSTRRIRTSSNSSLATNCSTPARRRSRRRRSPQLTRPAAAVASDSRARSAPSARSEAGNGGISGAWIHPIGA